MSWRLLSSTLLLLALMAGLAWSFFKLRNPDDFPLNHVKIEGSLSHLTNETVQEALSPYVMTGFFGIDLENIKIHLLEQPWIKNVFIQRVWPDTIVIKIEERKPYLRWTEQAVLSELGEVFYPDAQSIPQLPVLDGPDSQKHRMIAMYEWLVNQLSPIGFSVEKLELTPRGSWILTLGNNLTLQLGKDSIEQRVSRFLVLYPHVAKNTQNAIKYIDLRYPNGIAVGY